MHPDMNTTYQHLHQGLTQLQQQLNIVALQNVLQNIENQLYGMHGQEHDEHAEHADYAGLHPEMQQALQTMQHHGPPVDHSLADSHEHHPIPQQPSLFDSSQLWQMLTAGGQEPKEGMEEPGHFGGQAMAS